MSTFTKLISFIFLLILISSLQIHARDSKFFYKILSHNNNNSEKKTQAVKEQEPKFLPENENAYGLYGHESRLLAPSTTTNVDDQKTKPTNNDLPNSKYLPKNYNPMAYVTVPEDNTDETKSMNNEFTTNPSTNNNKYYEGVSTYNNNNNENYNSDDTNIKKNDNKEFYKGGSTYYNNKNEQQGLIWDKSPTTTYPNSKNNYYNNNQKQNNPTSYNQYNSCRVQQQGLSDTRFLENGKYFYDVNSLKYENSREFTSNNEYNSHFMEKTNQNEEEFQLDDEEMP